MSPRISQGRPSTDGAEADLAFALPLLTKPMEAKSETRLPEESGPWQYEHKWDGFRCLAFKSGKAVELRAKSGKPLGRYFPEVVAMLRDVAADHFSIRRTRHGQGEAASDSRLRCRRLSLCKRQS